MSIKYRELKRRYELDGAQRPSTICPSRFARSICGPRISASAIWPRRSCPTGTSGSACSIRDQRRRQRAGSRRRRRRDGVSEHHRPGDLLEDHGGLHARGVRRCRSWSTRSRRGSTAKKFPASRGSPTSRRSRARACRIRSLGFGEDYIETPSTTKRGFIVPVTKEAIFFDRTHLVLSRAPPKSARCSA